MHSIRILFSFILLLQVFHSAMADSPPAAALQQLQTLSAAGRTAEAIEGYQDLIARYPRAVGLYNNLAVLLAAQGNLDQARAQLEKAMHVDPVYAAVYENLTAIYVEMARSSYAKALQLGVKPQQVSLRTVDTVLPAASPEPAAGGSEKPRQTADMLAPDDSEAIRLTLQGWASAWSAQEVDLYLSFYAPEFRPARGMSRSRWRDLRRERLRRPAWVKVTLDDLQIRPAGEGRARVRFLQRYESDGYRDKTRKELVLKSSDGSWRILSERSL